MGPYLNPLFVLRCGLLAPLTSCRQIGQYLPPVLTIPAHFVDLLGTLAGTALADVATAGVARSLNAIVVALTGSFAVGARARAATPAAHCLSDDFIEKGGVDEHGLGAIDHEVGLEPLTPAVIGGAEVVKSRTHGSLVVICVREHGHELGTTERSTQGNNETVRHLLTWLESLGDERFATHRQHHVGQHHFERKWRRADVRIQEAHRLVERIDDGDLVILEGRDGRQAVHFLVFDN